MDNTLEHSPAYIIYQTNSGRYVHHTFQLMNLAENWPKIGPPKLFTEHGFLYYTYLQITLDELKHQGRRRMDEKEKVYWSIMDACIDVEEGEKNHALAAEQIFVLFENYILFQQTKEQRPL